MSGQRRPDRGRKQRTGSTEALLMRLDLAVETLENLDELGVDNRAELQTLLQQLERQVDDLDVAPPDQKEEA